MIMYKILDSTKASLSTPGGILTYWQNPEFLCKALKLISLLGVSLVINYFAVRFATLHAGAPLNDIFFQSFPYIDTFLIDYYGALFLQYGVFLAVIFTPKYFQFFIISNIALILVRDVFINLTYIGVPEGTIPTTSFFTQGGDLFFSGHTALPFLSALIFWRVPLLRNLFLILTFIMGLEVLLGRQHYSIDVLAAPFITYGVFTVVRKLFRREYDMMNI